MKKIISIITLILLTSCSSIPLFVDSESQIRRLVADLQVELASNKEELYDLRGKVEEVEHFSNKNLIITKNETKEQISLLQERILLLESFNETQKILNMELFSAVENNNQLIIKINKDYSNFRKEEMKIDTRQQLKLATEKYSAKEYEEAISLYSVFLENPNLLSLNEYRIVLYRVALSQFRLDKNKESLASFSQLYQKFHKEDDKYMASSLYHIGSLLIKEKNCKDAHRIFTQIDLEYKNHQYFNKLAKQRLNEINQLSFCNNLM